ncbi:MAG: carbamoyl-phosphate synthase large subunit, partial [Desulfosalsimonadaceae bacterium]
AAAAIDASLINQVMLEESILGWKEYELEVMRDKNDNVVIVCSIENFDPMGVHTGDSITVAPIQTLTDREYQVMRDASIAILREIGVETGGSNVQFAVNPENGEMIVVEMNPRVSRSSALASKATGFPIARIAAKLAVGYALDEITNDITGKTVASFEPALDYCVVKVPRWTFEKFPEAEDLLTTSMRSVGETMAIGRTFTEALQKGLRSLEIGRYGFGGDGRGDEGVLDLEAIAQKIARPSSNRVFYLHRALKLGMSVDEIYGHTGIDPWFLYQLQRICGLEAQIEAAGGGISEALLETAKENGFSDFQIGYLTGMGEAGVRRMRKAAAIRPVYKLVDTCAAEFPAATPYYYSTYEEEDEARLSDRKKIMILGGGPNRIGQGIEFDYCCVHASFALKEMGIESIMVNSNPETVSTDYDTSDKLYFEPLTHEDVLHIVETERPDGVIVQFGGQTPLNLSLSLAESGVPVIGTHPKDIERAEDRKHFQAMLNRLGLLQPPNGTARSVEEAVIIADKIGYPVIVRPSYVLGGRGMKIVYGKSEMENYTRLAIVASPEYPVLIDKFLEDAVEIDVDAVCDGKNTVIGGIMEHIEAAGVHSGDSACVLPPHSLGSGQIDAIVSAAKAMAGELNVIGLMNIQFAIKDGTLYVLEVNPRASRTVPFVSKATGVPLAKIATRVMLGQRLEEIGLTDQVIPGHVSVKEAVFPFDRFPDVDILLGPEMKSTGEVMGMDVGFGHAYAKAQIAAGQHLPSSGTIFISVSNKDKAAVLPVAQQFAQMGFDIVATRGTCEYFTDKDINCELVNKVSSGRPHVIDAVMNREIQLMINTGVGDRIRRDGYMIRRAALKFAIPYATTIAGASAMCDGIRAIKEKALAVRPVQDYHRDKTG